MGKKWLKYLGITIGLLIPVVPILMVIDYSGGQNAIFASGSSSILPLMQEFSKVYTKKEIVPTGGGSGKGLEDAVEGNTDFGDMSSNKKSDILKNKVYEDGWKKQKNRTITIAQDAEAIALNIPSDIKGYKTAPSGNLTLPIVRPWAIAEMYNADKTQSVKWSDLLEGSLTGQSANSTVQAYGREGGKAASGTSDGFFHTLENFASYAKPQIQLDENHASPKIKTTPEPNAQAYSVLNGDNANGLTYLSLGYLENILTNASSSNHVQLGFVDTMSGNKKQYSKTNSLPKNAPKWKAPTIDNSAKGTYGWIRPYNVAFSITNANARPYIYEFINWMLSDETQQTYVKNLFLVPIPKTAAKGKINLQDERATIFSDWNGTVKNPKSDFDLLNEKNNYAFGWQG